MIHRLTLDAPGRATAADAAGSLVDDGRPPAIRERARAGQTRQPRADDDRVGHPGPARHEHSPTRSKISVPKQAGL